MNVFKTINTCVVPTFGKVARRTEWEKGTSKRLTRILGRSLQCIVGCTEGQMLTDYISPEGKWMRNQLEESIPFLKGVSVWRLKKINEGANNQVQILQ